MAEQKEEEGDDEFLARYSIITIGNAAVGKSCLTLRFIDKEFQESYLTTVGLDKLTKKVKKKKKEHTLFSSGTQMVKKDMQNLLVNIFEKPTE